MKLQHEFIQLPLLFDVDALKKDIEKIPQEKWSAHHENFKGNFSVPLVSVGGSNNNDFKGQMAPTETLKNSQYLQQVVTSFGEVIGRSRLMALDPGAEVPIHSDINYHWYKRVRIHVPIVTDPNVIFHCGDKKVHMKAGEAWIFDSWKYHKVTNDSDLFRVHLVIDICGSSRFWRLVERGNVPGLIENTPESNFTFITPKKEGVKRILTEKFNAPLVISPGEMDGLADDLFAQLVTVKENKPELVARFIANVKGFCQDWRVLWTQFGLSEAGWPYYHDCRQRAFESVKQMDSLLRLENGTQAPRMFLYCMVEPALNPDMKADYLLSSSAQKQSSSSEDSKVTISLS